MRVIKFNKDQLCDEVKTEKKPVLNLVRVVFSSNDPNWVPKILSASIKLKAICYNIDKTQLQTISKVITLGSFITPYHKQPVLELNLIEKFESQSVNSNLTTYWTTSIEVSDIKLEENESLSLFLIERIHIQNRVDDWKIRIDNLFNEIKVWLNESPRFTWKQGKPVVMHEDLMQTFGLSEQYVSTLDIFYNKRVVLAIKPKGLWIIGANGRVDIISAKGSYMIVDFADNFRTPQWQIYTQDRKNKSAFSSQIFTQILNNAIQ